MRALVLAAAHSVYKANERSRAREAGRCRWPTARDASKSTLPYACGTPGDLRRVLRVRQVQRCTGVAVPDEHEVLDRSELPDEPTPTPEEPQARLAAQTKVDRCPINAVVPSTARLAFVAEGCPKLAAPSGLARRGLAQTSRAHVGPHRLDVF